MSFGLTFDKLLAIALIAAFLIGPERLPTMAGHLARFARSLRSFADGAKERLRHEVGPEFDEIDWQRLDPRRYDPRRIIRDALDQPIVPAPSKPNPTRDPAAAP